MPGSFQFPREHFMFDPLPSDNAFRVAEILPGQKDSPIICRLHVTDFCNPPNYEAISYAWGDITPTDLIVVNGKQLVIIRSLYTAINHMRYRDRSRFLWADFICNTNVWRAAIITEFKQSENWLSMLYLASNYQCWDQKAHVYGLRGLMRFQKGAEILTPDSTKTAADVYRDSVEAALTNFENTDVLSYVTSSEEPSWVPAWNMPRLFRNPYPFGHRLPWRPARGTKAVWSIDKTTNVLSVGGFLVDTIKVSQPYNERFFSNEMLSSEKNRTGLREAWRDVLGALQVGLSSSTPLEEDVLNATANAFSFGLDEMGTPAHESYLLRRFVAYLRRVLEKETFQKYIPAALSQACSDDSKEFVEPFRNFIYPDSSFFVTNGRLVGCCISPVTPGDVVAVLMGSTHPLVLRPAGKRFRIRGYTYTYGLMRGERGDTPARVLQIC
ncbi:hypothetical protein ABW21_db0205878 [Orbilia brochopaga]|nr:hypothetical protein ABW21_db0205878 [Drechslerella brochopaga]